MHFSFFFVFFRICSWGVCPQNPNFKFRFLLISPEGCELHAICCITLGIYGMYPQTIVTGKAHAHLFNLSRRVVFYIYIILIWEPLGSNRPATWRRAPYLLSEF
ncbi:hypothetical protein F5X99DRAFT_372803 [Biscogniauxia marginata]|nr:hypothetical protein F5X99DRAFT_372803 [Biscogniauxia marginata]